MKCKPDQKQYSSERNTESHLHRIFTAVPSSYDVINHLITLGMDVLWRKKAVKECIALRPVSVLDVCCGTGDMAMYAARLADGDAEITGLDFSLPMLDIAKKKAEKSGCKIGFVSGDVADIPFSEESFDSVCIGFGFRNLTYKNARSKRHTREILRILKPGGRFVIVESSQPAGKIVKFLHRLYVRYFVLFIGMLISGNRQAYQYLSVSVENYFSAEELTDLLLQSGFRQVTFKSLFFGAAAIHVAVK